MQRQLGGAGAARIGAGEARAVPCGASPVPNGCSTTAVASDAAAWAGNQKPLTPPRMEDSMAAIGEPGGAGEGRGRGLKRPGASANFG